jgi:hypothetical protein
VRVALFVRSSLIMISLAFESSTCLFARQVCAKICLEAVYRDFYPISPVRPPILPLTDVR